MSSSLLLKTPLQLPRPFGIPAGQVHVIVTFLAILELMKTGKIRISQEELFGDILIESLEDEDTVVVPYTDETDSEDKTDGRTEQE